MRHWLSLGIRLGVTAGVVSGIIVGLIAGIGGSVTTRILPDLAAFAIQAFLGLVLVLPLVYCLTFYGLQQDVLPHDRVRTDLYAVTAIAWLPAFLLSVITFMIPVVIIPLVLGRGVTLENSADWYAQIYTPLRDSRVLVVAIGTLIGFALAAGLLRTTNVFTPPVTRPHPPTPSP